MGNWRTVFIDGKCSEKDVSKLQDAITLNTNNWDDFHCLCYDPNIGPGICGLGNWAKSRIYKIGNLFERDYSVEDVKKALEIIGKKVRSADIFVHCGGDYESRKCVTTLHLKSGKVRKLKPKVKEIPDIPQEQMGFNIFNALRRR